VSIPWIGLTGLVIDLDPSDVPFNQVVECALVVHKLLDKAGAPNCCKTSGKRGLHVFVPLGAKYHFQQPRCWVRSSAILFAPSCLAQPASIIG
jgi:DNA primase